MGKYFVPLEAMTPADTVREAVGRAEKRVVSLRGKGAQALELLHLFDQIATGLAELQELGTDVRAEEARFETVRRQLQGRKQAFLSQVRSSLDEERRLVQPSRERWWWFLDEALAEERKHKLQRALVTGAIVVAAVVVLWFVYDRFIAPPPNVRQAFQASSSGEALVEAGDLQGALTEFEQAVKLDPTDADHLVWAGVVYQKLNQPEKAEAAFAAARALLDSDLELWLSRGMKYVRLGDLDAAEADVDQAIREFPDSGWAYTVKSSIAASRGDYAAATAALDKAAELAAQAGDTQLEAYARTQRAMLIQLGAGQMMGTEQLPTETP